MLAWYGGSVNVMYEAANVLSHELTVLDEIPTYVDNLSDVSFHVCGVVVSEHRIPWNSF